MLAIADRADHGDLLAADGWALAPTDSIRSMTAWISSSVAVGFITIIIWSSSLYAWESTDGGTRRSADARPVEPAALDRPSA